MLERLRTAMANMQVALQMLDDGAAPADIGAHLDLAICRLAELISETAGQTDNARSEMAAK